MSENLHKLTQIPAAEDNGLYAARRRTREKMVIALLTIFCCNGRSQLAARSHLAVATFVVGYLSSVVDLLDKCAMKVLSTLVFNLSLTASRGLHLLRWSFRPYALPAPPLTWKSNLQLWTSSSWRVLLTLHYDRPHIVYIRKQSASCCGS